MTYIQQIKAHMQADEGWEHNSLYQITTVEGGQSYRFQIVFTAEPMRDLTLTYPRGPWNAHAMLWRGHTRQEVPEDLRREIGPLLARRLLKDYLCHVGFEFDLPANEYIGVFGFRFLYGVDFWHWFDLRFRVRMNLNELRDIQREYHRTGKSPPEGPEVFQLMTTRVLDELPRALARVFPYGDAVADCVPSMSLWLSALGRSLKMNTPIDPANWRSPQHDFAWDNITSYVRLDPMKETPTRTEEIPMPKRKVKL